MINKKTRLTKQQLLTQEVIMALKNIKPSYKNWKNIMIKVNMLKMKHDVEVIKNTFDHALDIKQYCQNFILICLNEWKNQFQDNANQHLKIIESFDKTRQFKLKTAYIDYELILSLILQEYDTCLKKLIILQNDDEALIRTIIFKEANDNKVMLHNTRNEISFKLQTLQHRDHALSKIEMVWLEEKVSSAWNLLTTTLFKYLKDNQYRHSCYENQTEKNTRNQEIIVEHLTQITHLMGSINKFQRKIIQLSNTSNEQVLKFTSTKYLLLNKYSLMAKQYNKDQELDYFQLNLFVKQYNFTIKYLQNLTKKSQHILFLIRACRKFQMHSEKLLPVQDDQLYEEFDELEFFWYKVNTADLLLNNLKKEKQCLLEKWYYLCESLKFRLVN